MIHYLSSSHLVVQTYFPVIKGGIRLDTENFSFRVNQKLRFDQKSCHTYLFIIQQSSVFRNQKSLKILGLTIRNFYEFLQKLHDFIILQFSMKAGQPLSGV